MSVLIIYAYYGIGALCFLTLTIAKLISMKREREEQEESNEENCENCKHLKTYGSSVYYCDKYGGFHQEPEYCRDFKRKKET